MHQGFESSSIHKLLKACNVGFPEGKLHVKWCNAMSDGINITVAAEPEMVEYLRERKFQLHCGSTVITFRESKNRTLASRRLAKQARSSASQAAKAKAQAAKGGETPMDNPTAASAGAEASEPLGSGATAPADAASPEEAVGAEAPEPGGSGAIALAAPSPSSEAVRADDPGPSCSGASSHADSKPSPSQPPPSQSSSLPTPEANKAGSALLQSGVELAEDAKGDPTSPPSLPLGEASPSQDRPATPTPQANQGSLASCKASTGHQGISLRASKLAKTTGQGKKGNHKGSRSNRGR